MRFKAIRDPNGLIKISAGFVEIDIKLPMMFPVCTTITGVVLAVLDSLSIINFEPIINLSGSGHKFTNLDTPTLLIVLGILAYYPIFRRQTHKPTNEDDQKSARKTSGENNRIRKQRNNNILTFSKRKAPKHSGREKIIEKVCIAEHITKLTSDKYFIKRLETSARVLKSSCDISVESIQISKGELLSIADKLEIDVEWDHENKFPKSVKALCFKTIKVGSNGDERKTRKIIVRKGLNEIDERFALAHEIGHMVLGHQLINYNGAYNNFKNFRQLIKNEFEANHFAGALLINYSQVVKDIHNKAISVEGLASKYMVDYETMIYRLVLVADSELNFHLLKVDSKGNVIRKYGNGEYGIKWGSVEKACKKTAAYKVASRKECHTVCQISANSVDGKEEILYCYSRKITEDNKVFGLSIGTDKKHKDWFVYFKDTKNNSHILKEKIGNSTCDSALCPFYNESSCKVVND